MYMSGAPLYPITLALTARFREAIGADIPISYSAGVDQKNFADVVACGIKPVTTCTDLLRPGGYARLPKYLQRLARDMSRLNAVTVDEYIVARWQEAAGEGESATADAVEAGRRMTPIVAAAAAADPRYHAGANSAVPKRINSHLVIFDCVTCDKCIPVCPNDANFTYPLSEQDFTYRDWLAAPDGSLTPAPQARRFVTEKSRQIANFADYCNECGNCDTFCPEYGGPFIEKPTFFSRRDEFERYAPQAGKPGHDGFFVERDAAREAITGRIQGHTYCLTVDRANGSAVFSDGMVEVVADAAHQPRSARRLPGGGAATAGAVHQVDMGIYHTLRMLLAGVLDGERINPVNAALPD